MAELNSLSTLLGPLEIASSGIPTTNLRAYYKMSAGALTTDSSGNGYTLTNTNTVADGTGKFDGAADFSASNTNKKLQITSDLGITTSGAAMSMSLWVKLNAEIGSGNWEIAEKIWSNGSTVNGIGAQYQYNSGTRRLRLYRTGSTTANNYVTVTLGTSIWHHIVVSYTGSACYAYLDGVLVSGEAASGTIAAGGYSSQLTIGATNSLDNANYASVLVDDLAVYDVALTTEQVSTIYGAVAYWKLEDTSSSKGSYTLTNTSSVTFTSAKFNNGGNVGTAANRKYLSINNNLGIGTGYYTINVWVKWDGSYQAGNDPMIFAIGNATTHLVQSFRYATSGYLTYSCYGFNTSVGINLQYTHTLSTTNFEMLTMTWDGTTQRAYLNGNEVNNGTGTRSGSGGTDATAFMVYLGDAGINVADGKIGGIIDDVSVFSRALTAAEVLQLYQDRRSGSLFYSQI